VDGDPQQKEPEGGIEMLISGAEQLTVDDNEGAALTEEGMLKRSKAKFIGQPEGPIT